MCGTHTVWCYQAAIKAGKYHGGVLRDAYGAMLCALLARRMALWVLTQRPVPWCGGCRGTTLCAYAHAVRLRTRCATSGADRGMTGADDFDKGHDGMKLQRF
eukprot:1331770-Rhodomonas_salina.1